MHACSRRIDFPLCGRGGDCSSAREGKGRCSCRGRVAAIHAPATRCARGRRREWSKTLEVSLEKKVGVSNTATTSIVANDPRAFTQRPASVPRAISRKGGKKDMKKKTSVLYFQIPPRAANVIINSSTSRQKEGPLRFTVALPPEARPGCWKASTVPRVCHSVRAIHPGQSHALADLAHRGLH